MKTDIKIEKWNIKSVIPYENNVKNHEETQVRKIAKSIEDFGWDQPIVVDGDGVIIKGHGRRLAAEYLGLKEVPVVVRTDLSPEAVKAARIADNRVAESSIDTAMLQDELRSIEYDLHGIFDDKELAFLTADLGELNDGIFVDDLDSEVAKQSEETARKIEEVDGREVPITKALGFKSIPAKDEKHVAGFMAILEEQFGLDGVDSFVAFAKQMVSTY
jgi:ParB-like chromosome segregation protein Spo0J